MTSLSSRVPKRPDYRSPEAQQYRAWYKTKIWKAIRANQLATHPLCSMCEKAGRLTPATVCDHVTPHRGDWELFISGPFDSLCATHHNAAKQAEEHRGFSTAAGADGWPTDPRHPANSGKQAEKGRGQGLGPISHPYWFRPLKIPLTIVCGAPASGKTTYIARHKGERDVVLDLDAIALAMYGKGLAFLDGEKRLQCIKARNDRLGDLMRIGCRQLYERAWLIVSEPEASKRQWWADTLKPERIIVMETPIDECLHRASTGGGAQPRSPEAIRLWWTRYTKRDGDVVVVPPSE